MTAKADMLAGELEVGEGGGGDERAGASGCTAAH